MLFFNKSAKKVVQSDIDFKHYRVPLLTLDKNWYDMFPEERKTPELCGLEETLNKLVKERGKITNDLKDYQSLKKTMMDTIIKLTTEAFDNNNSSAKAEMDRCQRNIMAINDKLSRMQVREEELTDEIESANCGLLDTSVKLIYGDMAESKERLDTVDHQIAKLRETLKRKLDDKQTLEEHINRTYLFLDKLFGKDFIDKFDRQFEDQERERER